MKNWLGKVFGGEKPLPPSPVDAAVTRTAPEVPGASIEADDAVLAPDKSQALRSAEAQVAAEWQVGDVILDLYDVKQIDR